MYICYICVVIRQLLYRESAYLDAPPRPRLAGVRICTFVLVKPVNWGGGGCLGAPPRPRLAGVGPVFRMVRRDKRARVCERVAQLPTGKNESMSVAGAPELKHACTKACQKSNA